MLNPQGFIRVEGLIPRRTFGPSSATAVVDSGILTYGNTLEEAKKMAAEAVSGLLESYLMANPTLKTLKKLEQIFDVELISV
jgi:hypothetical protein